MEEEVLQEQEQEQEQEAQNDNTVTLDSDQLDSILDAIADRPATYRLNQSDINSIVNGINAGAFQGDSSTLVPSLQRSNDLQSFSLLCIAIIIGIMIIFFFRRKF